MTKSTKLPAPRESEILWSILAMLHHLGVVCWRANTGAFVRERNGRKRLVRFGVVGQSDILGLLGPSFGPAAGRACAIEVKRPGKRPTSAQHEFLRMVNDAGGIAFWACSAEQVERVMRIIMTNPTVRVVAEDDGDMYLTD